MNVKEAAKWLALFVLIAGGWFLHEHFEQAGRAFGLTPSMRGEIISVRAQVASLSSGKGHVFLLLRDPTNQKMIKGVLFKNEEAPSEQAAAKNLLQSALDTGATVEIDGTVEIYNGALEIIICKVR